MSSEQPSVNMLKKNIFLYLVLLYAGLHLEISSSLCNEEISRPEIIKRAKYWVDLVPYNRSTTRVGPNGKEYRTDCSGYISMAWNLTTSMWTGSMAEVSKPIKKGQLLSGDILLKTGEGAHALIFDKWSSTSKKAYWAYELNPIGTKYRLIKKYPYRVNPKGFSPYRYKNVVD